jgi:hypothetical protein
MNNKKLTDAEIKKALEDVLHRINGATRIISIEELQDVLQNSLNLINRQEVEVEAWKHYYNECLIDLKNAHVEIEKIKKDLKYYLDTNEENGVVYVPKFILDKILNEVGNA